MIIFLHMHKCAGSTVVRKARHSKLTFPTLHRNGNLVGADHKNLRYLGMDKEDFHSLLADLDGRGVEFFAMEWDFPPVENFACDVKIDLFTVVRDPLSRAISNFRFAKLSGMVDREVVFQQLLNWSYSKKGPISRSSDYFVRKLCGSNSMDVLNQGHLERAIEVLQAFKSVIVLERDNLDAELANLGINAQVKPAKQTDTLYRHGVRDGDLVVSEADQEWFRQHNLLDFALLESLKASGSAIRPAGV